MILESQADFARRCGVSRKTVSGWKKAGRLVLQGDQVDVEGSMELMNRHRKGGAPVVTLAVTPPVTLTDSGDRGGNKTAGRAPGHQAPEAPEEEIAMLPGETIDQAAERLAGEIDIDATSFDEARRIKEVYLALLNRLEYERKSGSLVDLDTAGAILFEEFRAQRDAWLNWPSRIAPILAAELGIEADRLTEALTAHVHSQIAQLGEPEANFSER